MPFRKDFDYKVQHRYVRAKVGGKWFDVSHFAKFDGVTGWQVWLCAGHGIVSGFVTCSKIDLWEYANF